jgi:hypothetical protein
MNSASETNAVGDNPAATATVVMVERVVTVEYMGQSMARNLLGKFPDSSAFDFDYAQSGIWSPVSKIPSASPASGAGSRDFLIAKWKRRARVGSRLKVNDAAGAGSGRSRWRRWRLRRDGCFLDLHETGMPKLDLSPPMASPSPAKVLSCT